MPRDFPFPGAKIVFIDNPADVHNLLSEIFGEDFPIGKNPTESEADFLIGKDDPCSECPVKGCADRTAAYEGADDEPCPIGLDDPVAQDCTSCDMKDCKVRVVPFGATVPVKASSEKEMSRALKDKALRDALRTEKLKLDIIEREAQLARQAMAPRSPYLWPAPSAEEFVEAITRYRDAANRFMPKVLKESEIPERVQTTVAPPKVMKPKAEVNYNLGKPFDSLRKVIEDAQKTVRAATKKRKDAELDDLAGRLFKKMSHQFYRDRGLRLSRINELTRHVSELFEENRTLKHDLRDKEKVIGFYRAAVENHDSVDWNKDADRKTGHLVYITDDEFETLKALDGGTAKVVPAPIDPLWFDFVDKETGKFVVPKRGMEIEVLSQRSTGSLLQRLVSVEATHPAALRFTHRPSGVTLFFTSMTGSVVPFGFETSKWRYKPTTEAQPPVPDDIPLNNMA